MRNFFVVNKITGDLEKLYLNNQKDINLVNMKMKATSTWKRHQFCGVASVFGT